MRRRRKEEGEGREQLEERERRKSSLVTPSGKALSPKHTRSDSPRRGCCSRNLIGREVMRDSMKACCCVRKGAGREIERERGRGGRGREVFGEGGENERCEKIGGTVKGREKRRKRRDGDQLSAPSVSFRLAVPRVPTSAD